MTSIKHYNQYNRDKCKAYKETTGGNPWGLRLGGRIGNEETVGLVVTGEQRHKA